MAPQKRQPRANPFDEEPLNDHMLSTEEVNAYFATELSKSLPHWQERFHTRIEGLFDDGKKKGKEKVKWLKRMFITAESPQELTRRMVRNAPNIGINDMKDILGAMVEEGIFDHGIAEQEIPEMLKEATLSSKLYCGSVGAVLFAFWLAVPVGGHVVNPWLVKTAGKFVGMRRMGKFPELLVEAQRRYMEGAQEEQRRAA